MPRVALVTGGTGGIGRAVVLELGRDHDAVAFTYRSPGGKAQRLAADLEQQGVRALAIQADLAATAGVGVVEQVLTAFGRLDSLVNNAGGASHRLIAELELREWDSSLRLNLSAPFQLSRDALPAMLRGGAGSIVNLGSPVSTRGGVVGVHYSAAKAGLIGLTVQLSRELRDTGVRVNLLEPAGIDTEFVRSMMDAAGRPAFSQEPQGKPEHVAAAVAFLCSPAAAFISGAVLPITGGWA
jgi:3-oxoacyl-[acyl-carrier protein] reductase